MKYDQVHMILLDTFIKFKIFYIYFHIYMLSSPDDIIVRFVAELLIFDTCLKAVRHYLSKYIVPNDKFPP